MVRKDPVPFTWLPLWPDTHRKVFPHSAYNGRDVQDSGDTSIPEDVKEKILRFTKPALAVSTLRGKAYLSVGGMSMGIAGSLVDQEFLLDYLGLRTEVVDMSEIARRVEEDIFVPEEFERALKWVKENCKEQEDTVNAPEYRRSADRERRTGSML